MIIIIISFFDLQNVCVHFSAFCVNFWAMAMRWAHNLNVSCWCWWCASIDVASERVARLRSRHRSKNPMRAKLNDPNLKNNFFFQPEFLIAHFWIHPNFFYQKKIYFIPFRLLPQWHSVTPTENGEQRDHQSHHSNGCKREESGDSVW